MVHKKGRFWKKQTPISKLKLVGYCLSDARRDEDIRGEHLAGFLPRLDKAKIERKIDAYYADDSESFFGSTIDDPITYPCTDAAKDLAETKAIERQKALERSVTPRHFRATAALVRRYFKVGTATGDLRSASCSDRQTCRVAIDTDVGDLGIIGDIVAGSYNRDYEAQLATPISDMFGLLFADKRFERGTVAAWLEVQTVGGKHKHVPALTVSCDRSADAKINWSNVGPAGLRTYCAYQLASIQGIG
jgi:hypothetical protein